MFSIQEQKKRFLFPFEQFTLLVRQCGALAPLTKVNEEGGVPEKRSLYKYHRETFPILGDQDTTHTHIVHINKYIYIYIYIKSTIAANNALSPRAAVRKRKKKRSGDDTTRPDPT